MGKPRLKALLDNPWIEIKVTETFDHDEVRLDVESRVALTEIRTHEDLCDARRLRREADLYVVERGRIYGWIQKKEDHQYGPWEYSSYELVFNGLSKDPTAPASIIPIGHYPRWGVVEFRKLAERGIAGKVCDIYRHMGYRMNPSWLMFTEWNNDSFLWTEPDFAEPEEDET